MIASTNSTPQLSNDHCFRCRQTVDQTLSITCSTCNLVSYCSHAHQFKDYTTHKNLCIGIQNVRRKDTEEQCKLKLQCRRCFTTDGAQQDHEHFWEWWDIRPAVIARYHLINELSKIPSKPALEEAMSLSMNILEINLSDNLDVQSLIPGLMIRLGRDREAIEFINRHRQMSRNCQYAWVQMDVPAIGSLNPDPRNQKRGSITGALSSSSCLDAEAPLAFRAALTLISLRLLFCLKSIENATLFVSRVPPEIDGLVRENIASESVRSDPDLWKEVRSGASMQHRISDLEKSLTSAFESIRASHPSFWSKLIQHDSVRESVSEKKDEPTPKLCEVHLVLSRSYDSWAETPGALEWARSKLDL